MNLEFDREIKVPLSAIFGKRTTAKYSWNKVLKENEYDALSLLYFFPYQSIFPPTG